MGGGGMVVPLFFFCLLVSSTTAQDETVSFSIAVNHTGREFRQFIVDVRARLRVPDRPFVMQDAGRLPAQEDVPTRFMNLELRTEDHGITLRMRMDNLYVLGFLNGIGGGTWYEFNGSNLITGSTTLGFGPEYRGVNANLPLGRPHVEVAIDQLAAHGNDGVILDNDSLRSHLRTLIVHFVESMRITDVSELVARRLAAVDEADSDPVGNLGDPYNLIQNWGTLSTLLYVAANDAVQDPLVLAQRFQVARGSAVPLQRKVVAVPMGSTLRVGAFLSDRNLVYDDEHLARGYFMFETPSLTGEDSGEIQGDKGRVKVQVTWSSWFT